MPVITPKESKMGHHPFLDLATYPNVKSHPYPLDNSNSEQRWNCQLVPEKL